MQEKAACHRRVASMETLLEPLLALDYVLPHPGLPWLLTERGIVACLKQLGIDTKLLPKRIDASRANGAIRYFHCTAFDSLNR